MARARTTAHGDRTDAGLEPGTGDGAQEEFRRRHVLTELGFAYWQDGEELVGQATITPFMHAPAAGALRTSILAIWLDQLTGLQAALSLGGRVPVTIELDVNLYAPAPAGGVVRGVARTVKSGRTTFVAAVDFTTGDGEPVGFGAGSFMSAPDPALRLPPLSIGVPPSTTRLVVPLAERVALVRRAPGVAVQPSSADLMNASQTLNGGLIALAAEEAALSLAPGRSLASIGLRYLQPVRVGPAVATASARGDLARVEVRDAGNDDRLAVIATTRLFPS
jgi:acyl-coenzyme A thioesterase PaaI-like protein